MAETQARHSQREIPERDTWIALALAFIAGSVDAIGYLLVFHIFTSHMSGNSVAMVVHAAKGQWRDFVGRVIPIVAFFIGVVFGLLLTDVLMLMRVVRTFTVVAAAEVAILFAFVALVRPAAYWLVVFPAVAMGIQNAMLRRVGKYGVRTTFVTGMLTNCAQGLVDRKFGNFALYGGIFLCFVFGGFAGASIEIRKGVLAAALPIAGLIALIVCDLVHPLTVRSMEQTEDVS